MIMEKLKEVLMSPKLWLSIVVIAVAAAIWLIVKRYAKRFITKRQESGKKTSNSHFVTAVIKYLILIFTAVTVLQINGINVTSLVSGLGIAGIIVGFALQDILKDLIMGTNIVWDGFFAVGDVVKYKNIVGKVTEFNIKVTKIYDINTGNMFTVCNRNISEIERVSDWLDIIVPTSYGEDDKRMREICADICRETEKLPDVSSCDFLGTDEFAASQINYRLRIHCPPELKAPMRRACLGIIQDAFGREGVQIPFPQLDVHMDAQGKGAAI